MLNITNVKSKEFIDLMFSNGFFPLIKKAKKYFYNSNNNSMATLIYHIWSNVPSKSQISIIDFSISNHLTNFSVFNYRFIFKFNEIKKVYFRDFSIKNKQDFINKINDSDWLCYNKTCLVDFNANIFMKKLYDIYNECFPIRMKQVYNKRLSSPWLSKVLLSKFCQKKIKKETYTSYRNKLSSLIRKRKTAYFKNKFSENMNNLRVTWRNINNLILNNKN